MKLLTVQFFSSPLSPPLTHPPKYLSQHPIFVHPQPTFLPQCDRPSFTPIQNSMQNYSPTHFNLYILGHHTGRQKILHLKAADTA